MADKQKSQTKKSKVETPVTKGPTKKEIRNLLNQDRHDRNLHLAKVFGIDSSKKGFRKLVKKAVDEQNKWVSEEFAKPIDMTLVDPNRTHY